MQTKCPGCEKILKLPDNAGGKRIKCPACNHAFVIPIETKPIEAKEIEQGIPNMGNDIPSAKDYKSLIQCIVSAKSDIERSLKDRDEAMELVDKFFQMFLERADNPELSLDQQAEYRDIAQKIFELQKKFPLLSGVRDVLAQCENTINNLGT